MDFHLNNMVDHCAIEVMQNNFSLAYEIISNIKYSSSKIFFIAITFCQCILTTV
ncbi:hypothetical protein AALP_AA6G340700 [Arabis alpina]|uniref:Uncharacterized protein n=1 Tax=Arabis alpina TaxID=50452 RepID=A0A087GTH8_ARAAL|nr:hypothetical protein AALP_AA6G340700 [Arabis alpina]